MSKLKMSFRWTDTDTILLIQLYKTFPFLWDPNHKLYKNSIARTHAYTSILEKMEQPSITVKDIRSKIKNLRTSYYLEVKKMSKAQEMGLVYTTKLPWFDFFKDIMDTVLVQKQEAQSDSDDSFEIMEENSTDAYVVTIKQEYLDELEKQGDKNAGPIGDYLEPATAPPAPKRFRAKQGGFKEMKEETRKECSKKDRDHFEVDEFQLFANNMAEQLRKMPIVKALSLQLEVQTLVAKTRIDMYKKKYGPQGKDDDE